MELADVGDGRADRPVDLDAPGQVPDRKARGQLIVGLVEHTGGLIGIAAGGALPSRFSDRESARPFVPPEHRQPAVFPAGPERRRVEVQRLELHGLTSMHAEVVGIEPRVLVRLAGCLRRDRAHLDAEVVGLLARPSLITAATAGATAALSVAGAAILFDAAGRARLVNRVELGTRPLRSGTSRARASPPRAGAPTSPTPVSGGSWVPTRKSASSINALRCMVPLR